RRESEPGVDAALRAVHGGAGHGATWIELIVAYPEREYEVRAAELAFRVRGGGQRREVRRRRGRDGIAHGQIAQDPLEHLHALAGDLAAEIEIAVWATQTEVGLAPHFAEAIPCDRAGRAASQEERRHAPRGPIAQVRRIETGDRRACSRGIRVAYEILTDEMKRAARERPELVTRLFGERATREGAREVSVP